MICSLCGIDRPETFPMRVLNNRPACKPRCPEAPTNAVWLVVVSQGGKALGVFGSALSREAQQCAARVQVDTGFGAWIVTVRGARPSVGDPMPLVLLRFPSGRWGFGGRVPASLALVRKDGAPMTPEDFDRARDCGAPALFGYTTRAWGTEEEALAAAETEGALVTQVCR